MIRSFQHKGLEAFFHKGTKAGIQPSHAGKLKVQLATLDNAKGPRDMDAPGWKLHALTGSLAGYWSVGVNGNWRLIFRFVGEDAELVDYLDYH